MVRTDRPEKPLRWVRSPWGGGRVAEYRVRDAGHCVGCSRPSSWIWIGECDKLRHGWDVADARRVPIGYALQVRGVDRRGRVTCAECRARGAS